MCVDLLKPRHGQRTTSHSCLLHGAAASLARAIQGVQGVQGVLQNLLVRSLRAFSPLFIPVPPNVHRTSHPLYCCSFEHSHSSNSSGPLPRSAKYTIVTRSLEYDLTTSMSKYGRSTMGCIKTQEPWTDIYRRIYLRSFSKFFFSLRQWSRGALSWNWRSYGGIYDILIWRLKLNRSSCRRTKMKTLLANPPAL